jgi:iron complex transport system substrate-binding protein
LLIERVAQALGVSSQPVLAQLQERIEKIVSQTNKLAELERPTVVALEWIEPLMGAGNWIPELIEMAGGKPLLGVAGQHSTYFSWDNLIQVDPDMIIIMPCGFNLEKTGLEAQLLSQHSEWKKLKYEDNKS